MFIPDLLHGQDADSGGLSVRPWIQRAAGLVGWARLPPGPPLPGPGKALPIHPLGWWDWATWGAENACWLHRFHSTHHPRLLSQPWEGNVPSRRHPNPTKRPLLELEVRICGRRDSWVQVPASCQSPGRWANISGIKRGAACPARPSERDAAGRWVGLAGQAAPWSLPRALSCEERVLGRRIGGRVGGGPQASVWLLEGPL